MSSAEPPNFGADEKLETWETDAIRAVASSFNIPDREDLEAELAWRLLVFKRKPQPAVKNWRGYTFTFLRNRARDWIKMFRKARGRTISFDQPTADHEEMAASGDPLPTSDQDLPLALSIALSELPSHLRKLWRLRVEEGLNLNEAASRLGRHRNTVRYWTRKIRRILESHGVGKSGPSHNWVTPPPQPTARKSFGPRGAKGRDFKALETRRKQAVALVLQGSNQSEVSRRLRVARQTVCRWMRQYRKGDRGLTGTGRVGRPRRLTQEDLQVLGRLLRAAPSGQPMRTARQVAQLIEDNFGVHYHIRHVWKLLRGVNK